MTSTMRIVLLSDTHSPRRWKRCPSAVARVLDGADAILHAGDVCLPETLDELSEFGPVHAVRGNNDGPDVAAWGAPETLEHTFAGLPIAMIHDSGPAKGRAARLKPGSRPPDWWCSGTRTFPGTRRVPVSARSIRARPPIAAANRTGRSST